MTPRSTVRRDIFVLCLLAFVLFLPGLGSRDLWNPNEPTYGLAVAEMTDRGEWWIPTVNGVRFLEKPILYFWLARVATLAGGVNEFALRLPSMLAALVSVVFVYLLGLRQAGRSRGVVATLLFVTTVSIAQAARMIQMDLLATAAVAATVYWGLAALERPRAWAPWFATGLAAGAGFLAKGPVSWILAAIPLAAALAVARPKPLPAVRCVVLALAALLATISVWIVPLALRGEWAVLHEAIVRQNFTRFFEPWDHVQPWWYFLKYVWIDMAPWAFLLPLAVGGRERDAADRKFSRVAWVWLIGAIVFFSLSASKRSAYLMPAAPAVALLAAGVVERLFRGTLGALRRRMVFALLGLSSLTMLGAAWVGFGLRGRYPDHSAQLTAAAVALIVSAGAILVALGMRPREKRAALCFLAVLVTLELGLAGWLMPYANVFKSARSFAAETVAVAGDDTISGYRLWIWRADYPYYIGRRIGRVENPGEAASLWNGDERHCMIVEEWNRKEFLEAVGPAVPRVGRDVGSKRVELYCNR
jgi:4-amino-4-deoxy-L-arabinose transferase-like glycosyltransferase